ncbi:hypothetical protein BHE74_00028885 [Ensete ventricosum]|nr:hypothetical protein BHE74_00028885 [Ensete ventricosum]
MKSKEEAAKNSKHKSPFAPKIWDKPIPANFRLSVLESYGSSDPTEHVAAFRAQMALYDSSDALMCQVFLTTLRGPARMWYDRLQPASIISFYQLARELEQNFLANARPKPTVASLLGIAQGREEPLAQFVNRFTTESRVIPDAHPSLVIQAFLMGIRQSKLFWSLVEKPLTTIRGKGLLAPPNRIKTRLEERDKGIYYRFHREYDHDTEECRDLKNQIEDLIRQGHLGHYVQR